ncbi:PAS domain S-box protein [Halovivax gelatinilyticus]|uniref:PAS domain S-box protein n=1 Tax=Halovivax gelatinilyticus TaxID=2961597 RepID=UPI0020CA827B|nr:PAS domain S-box protein [Halovivax gelatinilyticus]
MASKSDRKQRDEAFSELTQFRDAIIQSANVWINALDEDGTVTLWNEAAEEISGYAADEVVGSDEIWTWLYPDETRRNDIMDRVSAILRGNEAVEGFRTTIVTKDGSERTISWNSHAIVDADGALRGSVAIGRDITERTKRERELRRQHERLNEFTSIVSHDLRNPINIAQGYLEAARSECSSEHLDDVAVALERIDQIVNQTLSLARHGKLIDETEPVDVARLAEACWKGVDTASADLQLRDPPVIQADPRAVRHLLENLFRNSVEHGGEDVTVRVGPCDGGFYVEDDGVGLPDNGSNGLFDPTPSAGGDAAGLGLAIVNRIVEAHEWEIRVGESDTGGARFEILAAPDR